MTKITDSLLSWIKDITTIDEDERRAREERKRRQEEASSKFLADQSLPWKEKVKDIPILKETQDVQLQWQRGMELGKSNIAAVGKNLWEGIAKTKEDEGMSKIVSFLKAEERAKKQEEKMVMRQKVADDILKSMGGPDERSLGEKVKSPKWWVDATATNLPNMVLTMIPTTLAKIFAAPISAPISFAAAATIEGGAAYNQAIDFGATEEQADLVSKQVGIVNGVLETIPILYLLNDTPAGKQLNKTFTRKLVETIVKQVKREAPTEMLQEVVGNTVSRVYNPEAKIFNEAVVEAGLVAIGTGTVAGGGVEIFKSGKIGFQIKDINTMDEEDIFGGKAERSSKLRPVESPIWSGTYTPGIPPIGHEIDHVETINQIEVAEELEDVAALKRFGFTDAEIKSGKSLVSIYTKEFGLAYDGTPLTPDFKSGEDELATYADNQDEILPSIVKGFSNEQRNEELDTKPVGEVGGVEEIQQQLSKEAIAPVAPGNLAGPIAALKAKGLGSTLVDPTIIAREQIKRREETTGRKLDKAERNAVFGRAKSADVLGRRASAQAVKVFNIVYEWMTRPTVNKQGANTSPEAIASVILSRGENAVARVLKKVSNVPSKNTIAQFWQEVKQLPVKLSHADLIIAHPMPSDVGVSRGVSVPTKIVAETKLPDPKDIKTVRQKIDAVNKFVAFFEKNRTEIINFVDSNPNVSFPDLIETVQNNMKMPSQSMKEGAKMIKSLLDKLHPYLGSPVGFTENYFPHVWYGTGRDLVMIFDKYMAQPFAKQVNFVHLNTLARKKNAPGWSENVPEVLKDYIERTAILYYSGQSILSSELVEKIKTGKTKDINLVDAIQEQGETEVEQLKIELRENIAELKQLKVGAEQSIKDSVNEEIEAIRESMQELGKKKKFTATMSVISEWAENPFGLYDKLGILQLMKKVAHPAAYNNETVDRWKLLAQEGNTVQLVKLMADELGLEGNDRVRFQNDVHRRLELASKKGNREEILNLTIDKTARDVVYNKALLNLEDFIKTHTFTDGNVMNFINDIYKKLTFERSNSRELYAELDKEATRWEKAVQKAKRGFQVLKGVPKRVLATRYIGANPRSIMNNFFELERPFALFGPKIEAKATDRLAKEGLSILKKYDAARDNPYKMLLNKDKVVEFSKKDVKEIATELGKKGFKTYGKISDKVNFGGFSHSENLKNANILYASEIYWTEQGLTGEALTDAVLLDLHKYSLTYGIHDTPKMFNNRIVSLALLFQQYTVLDMGHLKDTFVDTAKGVMAKAQGKPVDASYKRAGRYLWRLFWWKNLSYLIKNILWGETYIGNLFPWIGMGPLGSLGRLAWDYAKDLFNGEDEDGLSVNAYTQKKAEKEARALGWSLIGVPGGLLAKISEEGEAQKAGGVFSAGSGNLRYTVSDNPIRRLLNISFGLSSSPEARVQREGKYRSSGKPELPLGATDTEEFRNLERLDQTNEQLESFYLDSLLSRRDKAYITKINAVNKEFDDYQITTEERDRRIATINKNTDADINKILDIKEKGYRVITLPIPIRNIVNLF